MFDPWIPNKTVKIMLGSDQFDAFDGALTNRMSLREPYVGTRKRQTGGTNRDKVKAARKQNRRKRK